MKLNNSFFLFFKMLGLFRVFVVGSVRYTSSYKKNYLPSLISTALSLHVQIFLRYFFTHSSLSFLSFWLSNLSKYRFNSDLFFLVNNKIKLNSFFNLFFKKTNFFLDTSTNSYYVDDSNVELLSLDQSFEYPNIDFIASDWLRPKKRDTFAEFFLFFLNYIFIFKKLLIKLPGLKKLLVFYVSNYKLNLLSICVNVFKPLINFMFFKNLKRFFFIQYYSSDSDTDSDTDSDPILIKKSLFNDNFACSSIISALAVDDTPLKLKSIDFFNKSLKEFLTLLLSFKKTGYDDLFISKNSKLNNLFKSQINSNLLSSSNCYPFFYLDSLYTSNFKRVSFDTNVPNYSHHIRQYLSGFIESFTSRKVFLKIKTELKIPNTLSNFIKDLISSNWFWQRIIGVGFFLVDAIYIVLISIFKKDLNFLMSWFSRAMGKLGVNRHKKFIRFFKLLFLKNESFILTTLNVKGFKFDIRGKVGVSGNSKKRHSSFYIGVTSFSNKSYRLYYQQGLVYTDTGVLGVTMILSI